MKPLTAIGLYLAGAVAIVLAAFLSRCIEKVYLKKFGQPERSTILKNFIGLILVYFIAEYIIGQRYVRWEEKILPL